MKVDEVGRVWFDDSCSPEELSAIRPLLAKHERMIPPWIDALHVKCVVNQDENRGCTAQIETEAEYRRAHLTIFSIWLGEIPEHREQSIVHELLHLYTNAQRLFAREAVLLHTTDKPDLKDYLLEQLRKANEATTEDLTLLLRRLGYFEPVR